VSLHSSMYPIFIRFLSLGEVCSHVAAVLFKIEAACRLGYTNPSCTSMPCKWNKTFVEKVCTRISDYYIA
jgi:hypothetical protein